MKTQPNSAVTETLLYHEQTKNHQRASEPTFATRISIMISTKAFVEPNGKAAWQIVLVIFIGVVFAMVVKLLWEQFTRL